MSAADGSRGSAGARARLVSQRLGHAWRALAGPQRTAAVAAIALAVTMLLPWYSLTGQVARPDRAATASRSALLTAGWVELAILLVVAAVLTLLYMRAERRAFHLPGGDGTVIFGAGVWVGLLLLWRLFDRPAYTGFAVTLSWGFFVACAATAFLIVAGLRLRAAHTPEPPLRRSRDRDAPGAEEWLNEERPHLAPTQVIGGEPRGDRD
jgi:hypothetical protein